MGGDWRNGERLSLAFDADDPAHGDLDAIDAFVLASIFGGMNFVGIGENLADDNRVPAA